MIKALLNVNVTPRETCLFVCYQMYSRNLISNMSWGLDG
jgi:hypothetical protein